MAQNADQTQLSGSPDPENCPPPIPVPDDSAAADVLLAYYKEHGDQARQHENQRERMTTLIVAIGAGTLGLAALKVEGLRLDLFGWILVVLGIYGAIFSLKHYEKNRYHVGVMKQIRRKLRHLVPDSALEDQRGLHPGNRPSPSGPGSNANPHVDADSGADRASGLHAYVIRVFGRIRLYWLWTGLPLLVSLVGVILLFSRTCQS